MKTLELIEYLQTQKEDINWVCEKTKNKSWRTLSQNKAFQKLFTDIWNHLWEDKDDIHDMMLWWVFGTKEVTIGRITKDVLIEKHTANLSMEKWTKLIDTILAFCKKYDLPITITSREIQSLYESYN